MNSPFRGLDGIRQVYFIGIGGIGMSAIARFFQSKGVAVSGYDKTRTALTEKLEAAGMAIHYEERVDLLPKDPDLIVYTPAIPKDHKELAYYEEAGKKVIKRSDVLQLITESSFNICIAGTHGKTTVTTMTAHLLRDTGFGCNAFLGGIAANYDTNFWSDDRNVCVIEADEFDRSFLKLSPDIAIITSMDADHLDIYGTADAVEEAFISFAGKVKADGCVVAKKGLKQTTALQKQGYLSYSQQDVTADAYATNIVLRDGGYDFTIVAGDKKVTNLRLNMGGMHNVENMVAAVTVALLVGIEEEKIRGAVASFRGVKRRFEYIVKQEDTVYIDDYAHHPEELRALLTGARSLFMEKKCTVLFQPHLFTRTRDFAAAFAEALSLADEVWLLPIYPAREKPIEGVSSSVLASMMEKGKVQLLDKSEVADRIASEQKKTGTARLWITAGAGDIDTLVPTIKKILLN